MDIKAALHSFFHQSKLSEAKQKRVRQWLDMQDEKHSGLASIQEGIEIAELAKAQLSLKGEALISALAYPSYLAKETTKAELEEYFGAPVARICEDMSRFPEVNEKKLATDPENFRRLLLALSKDLRSLLVKFSVRLFRAAHFEEKARESILRTANENMYLYAPVAHRLGLYHVKQELEDTAMKALYPEEYYQISQKLSETQKERQEYIKAFSGPIRRELEESGYSYQIKGRPKTITSIWRKMEQKKVDFDEIGDLFAIRIILDVPRGKEKSECWNVYSIISSRYRPNPARFRDWISTPRPSGYESLHTTVKGPDDKWVEVQIRSVRMDEEAEKGSAAHWRYKENPDENEKGSWLERLRNALENPDDEDLKNPLEAYPDRIFVLTPKGDVGRLRKGATVLDFAYSIHSKLGHQCTGALVNGRSVSFKHRLTNGDVVEVRISAKQQPKQEWLKYLTSAKSRQHVKRALRVAQQKGHEDGKEILARKFRNWKVPFNDESIDILLKHFKYTNATELYALIADEKIDLNLIKSILNKRDEEQGEEAKNAPKEKKHDVPDIDQEHFEGDYLVIDDKIDQVGYRQAQCCKPRKGDKVFGFVTVNKGISIHKTDCRNTLDLITRYPYRIIKVKWKTG